MKYEFSGIDISKWQPPEAFDWKKIAENHQFMIARACYGVKSDPTFGSHFKSAHGAGLKCGAYTFYRQTQGWEEQLEAFQGELDRVGLGPGDILPVVDLEWNKQYDGKVDPAKFNADARKLMEVLAKMHGGCIAYLAPGFFETLKKPDWLLEYPWWIAHYGVEQPWCPWKDWTIWQYTGKGKTPGYSGAEIDMNWAVSIPLIEKQEEPEPEHEIPDISNPPEDEDDDQREPPPVIINDPSDTEPPRPLAEVVEEKSLLVRILEAIGNLLRKLFGSKG